MTAYENAIEMADFDFMPTAILSMWNIYRHSPFPLLALLRSTCSGVSYSFLDKKSHNFGVTDPRDKIYGLLGLAVDRDELEAFDVVPNYTKSCGESLYGCYSSDAQARTHITPFFMSVP